MRVIDRKNFMDTFQYFDKEIVVEIIEIFINEHKDRLNAIQNDINQLDFNSLKFNAHSLKGVISNFVALEPQQTAKYLEIKGSEKDSSGLQELYLQLEKGIYDLVSDLTEIKTDFEG